MNQILIDGPKKLLNSLPKIVNVDLQNKLIICGLEGDKSRFSFHLSEDLPIKSTLDGNYFDNLIKQLNKNNCDSLVIIFYLSSEINEYKEISKIYFRNLSKKFHVKDLIWVNKGNWASYLCEDLNCCPKDGTKIEENVGKSTKKVFDLDLIKLNKIDSKIRSLSSKAFTKRSELKEDHLIKKWQKTQFDQLIAKNALDSNSKSNWSRLLVALTDIPVRDALLSHYMELGFTKKDPSKFLKSIAKNWLKIATISPAEFHSPIFACISAFLWQAKELEAAKFALQISLKNDPKFRLANLLSDAIESGVKPSEFKDVFKNPMHPWS